MRYLIISERGATVSLAAALEREGHSASVHIVNPSYQNMGVGLSMCVRTPRPLRDASGSYNLSTVEWLLDTARPDLTIFDSPETHVMATRMRKAGRLIIGPTTDSISPQYPPLSGSAQAVAWFDGNAVVGPVLTGRMYDRYMPDDVGPLAPMSGFIFREAYGPDLGLIALNALAAELRHTTYRGPIFAQHDTIEVNYVGTGWSPGHWGWFENTKVKISQFLMSLAQALPTEAKCWSAWVAGVRLSIPTWPYANLPEITPPAPVYGLTEPALRHFWFEDLAHKATDDYHCSRSTNSLGFVTARGDDPREAVRRMYRTVSNISVEGLQYRTDIGRYIAPKQEVLNGSAQR